MRFKIDEHLPLEIKDLLAQHQHDPVTVPDEGMAGSIDPEGAGFLEIDCKENVRRVRCRSDWDF